jgi:hypothetical protein
LLPAIQSSREMARRTKCLNQLSQLMLALHSYELAHRAFPPGTVDARRPIVSRPFGYHHGWIEQLVPFLEEKAIYHQADRQLSAYDPVNHAARIELPSLVCPSQVIEGEGYSCYAAVHHHVEWPIDVRQQGVFFLNSRIRLDDVTDGLANTLFLGEKLIEPGDLGWYSGTRSILRNTGERLNTASRIRRTQFWKVDDLPPDMSTVANQQGMNLFGGSMGFMGSNGSISYDERPFTQGDMLALTEPLGHEVETQGIGSSSERSPSDPGNRSLESPVEPAKPPASPPSRDSAGSHDFAQPIANRSGSRSGCRCRFADTGEPNDRGSQYRLGRTDGASSGLEHGHVDNSHGHSSPVSSLIRRRVCRESCGRCHVCFRRW